MGKDIYGREIPEPAWHKLPPRPGYYFLSRDRRQWDIPEMVRVHSIEDCYGKRMEVYIQGHWVTIDPVPQDSVDWYGPFLLAKPDWA